ncbi:MAG: hypothetical protein ACUVTM_07445 [Candidatus Bathyarchaeia archaeon]
MMDILKKRTETEVFTGGEVGVAPTIEGSNTPKGTPSMFSRISKEMVGSLFFTATTISALIMHYSGFGLMEVIATFLAGLILKLLLNKLG